MPVMLMYGTTFNTDNVDVVSCLLAPGSGAYASPACVFSGAASVNT